MLYPISKRFIMFPKIFLIIAGILLTCVSCSEPEQGKKLSNSLSEQELEPFYVNIVLKYPNIAKIIKEKYGTFTAPYAYWAFSGVKDPFIKKLQLPQRIILTSNQVNTICNLIVFISNKIPNSSPKATMSPMFFAAKYANSTKMRVDEVVIKLLDATQKIKSKKKQIDILEMILNLGLLPSTYQTISSNRAIYKDISQIMNDFNSDPKDNKLHLLVYGLLLNYYYDKEKIRDIYSKSSDYDYESTYNLIDFMTGEKISSNKEFYKWLKSFKYSKENDNYYKRYVEFSKGKGPDYRRMIRAKKYKTPVYTVNSSCSPSFYENDPNRQYLAFIYFTQPQIFKSIAAKNTWTAPYYTVSEIGEKTVPSYFDIKKINRLLKEEKLNKNQIEVLWMAVPQLQANDSSREFLCNLVNVIEYCSEDKKYALNYMMRNTEKLTDKETKEWLAREYKLMSKEITKSNL